MALTRTRLDCQRPVTYEVGDPVHTTSQLGGPVNGYVHHVVREGDGYVFVKFYGISSSWVECYSIVYIARGHR